MLANDPYDTVQVHRSSEAEGPLHPGAPGGKVYLCSLLLHQMWQKPLAHTAPKLGRCTRAASRVGGNWKKCKSHTLYPCCGAIPPLTNKKMVCGPTVSWSGRGRWAKPRCPSPYPPRVPSESRHSESPTPAPAHRATRKFKTVKCSKPSNPRWIYY